MGTVSRMTIIAIAGQKGGAGKSTIAVCLAAEWHAQGRRVLLVDADPQATALTWAEVASEQERPTPTVIAMGDNLRQQLPQAAEGFDVVIIDCPGRKSSKRQVGAMMLADVTLLPCGPSTPDVWALSESVELVQEVLSLRAEMHAAIVCNRRTATTEGRTMREALGEVGLPMLSATLGQRVAYSEALAGGCGVSTYARGGAAASEIRLLADEIDDLVNPKPKTKSRSKRQVANAC